jgi:hypothetical protein
MFYTIHRCLKILAYAAVCLLALKLYESREVFEPALIWYDVWDNGGLHVPEPKAIAGRVLHVANSQTFMLSTRDRRRFNVRLMGLKPPLSADRSVESIEKEKHRRDALEEMIRGEWVYIELAYENFDSIGGVVFLGPTNVNADLVLHGLASKRRKDCRRIRNTPSFGLSAIDKLRRIDPAQANAGLSRHLYQHAWPPRAKTQVSTGSFGRAGLHGASSPGPSRGPLPVIRSPL